MDIPRLKVAKESTRSTHDDIQQVVDLSPDVEVEVEVELLGSRVCCVCRNRVKHVLLVLLLPLKNRRYVG
jgi:hypothetical protein